VQTLAFQNHSNQRQVNLIFHNQKSAAKSSTVLSHTNIRNAVRAWASAEGGQECVAAIIVQAWQERGGAELRFPADIAGQKQKLFRWLDGDSPRYQRYVRELTPVILDVLPLEFRVRLVPEDSFMSRLARLEKETSEAKVAVAMNAPHHQKLKELSEGIVELFRVDPDLTAPLMAMVTTMLGTI